MDRLPSQPLEEILFKPDPKSLAMMQCTSGSIKSHITDDPVFMSKYLSRVGSGLFNISSFGSSILLCHSSGSSCSTRTEDLDHFTQILGSCSGLLLLFIDGLYVANPTTKKFRFLDHSESIFLPKIVRSSDRETNSKLLWAATNRIGFAVDQIDRTTQRFRIVCLIETEIFNPDETMYRFEINNGDSCWRLSKTTITCRSSNLIKKVKPVYLEDGALYWLRNDGSIVAFNPETEQVRLIPIEFPEKLSSTILFATGNNELALVWPTEEMIYVYALENNILTDDPKWVIVRRIENVAVDKALYWNVVAYDGKCLVVRLEDGCSEGVVHGYDLRANKWGVVGSMPVWCDSNEDLFQFKPSLASAIELDENLDVVNVAHHDKRISTLGNIMRLIQKQISPYAKKLCWRKRRYKGENNIVD